MSFLFTVDLNLPILKSLLFMRKLPRFLAQNRNFYNIALVFV